MKTGCQTGSHWPGHFQAACCLQSPHSLPYSTVFNGTQGTAFALLESVLVEHPSNTRSSCSTELGPCSTCDLLPAHPTWAVSAWPYAGGGSAALGDCVAVASGQEGSPESGERRAFNMHADRREPPTVLALWAARHTGRGAPQCWGQLSYEAVVPVNSQNRSETRPGAASVLAVAAGIIKAQEQELAMEV